MSSLLEYAFSLAALLTSYFPLPSTRYIYTLCSVICSAGNSIAKGTVLTSVRDLKRLLWAKQAAKKNKGGKIANERSQKSIRGNGDSHFVGWLNGIGMLVERPLFLLCCTCLLVSGFWSTFQQHIAVSYLHRHKRAEFKEVDIFVSNENKYGMRRAREVESCTSLFAAGSGGIEDSAVEELLLSLSVKSVEIFESAAGTIKGKRTMVS